VNDAEDSGVGTDPERHRQDDGRRETAVAQQAAQRGAKIMA
jgi:hypothetical protein